MEVSTVDIALKYAEKGFRVFPLNPRSKHPWKDFHWDVEATAETNKILGWWEYNPQANLAIATGPESGIFVLDIDGEEGAAWLNRMVERHGDLPKTPTSLTKKGRHFLFRYPEGRDIRNSQKKIAPGVDIRGAGGYIVAPPSIHPDTGQRYTWDKDALLSKTPIADAPEWLLAVIELVSQQQAAPTQTNTTETSDQVYSEGSRNGILTSLAGSMRRRGMDYDAILAALKVENIKKCVPPLADKEVETIARSVTRYDPTAAPAMAERDRLAAEWGFARAVYIVPDYIKEFMWLPPSKFANEKLGKFWTELLNGSTPVQAATEAGILADVEKMTTDPTKIDQYAQAIDTFGYFDTVRKYAGLLDKAATSGDAPQVDRIVTEIARNVQPTTGSRVADMAAVVEAIDVQIEEREKNPTEIWGIPYSPLYVNKDYSWTNLSKYTGGKQPNELLMVAGEPGVGKSWWTLQDALFTAISGVPVFIWSGEMKREQVVRRMYQILGVNGRNMKTGQMTHEDKQFLAEAKALILNSPIYISDEPGLALHDLKALLYRQKTENGIQQFVIDYAYLVGAPGKDEVERTANVSRETKIICNELELAGVLIASVNKQGMDNQNGQAMKSNMRGSGQQIHDADVIYHLTKFSQAPNDPVALRYLPSDYDRLVTLHFTKGRELDASLPGARLHFARINNSPAFREEAANPV